MHVTVPLTPSISSLCALCTVHLEHRHHAGTRAAAGAQDGGGPGAPHAALPRQGRDGRVPRQGATVTLSCAGASRHNSAAMRLGLPRNIVCCMVLYGLYGIELGEKFILVSRGEKVDPSPGPGAPNKFCHAARRPDFY